MAYCCGFENLAAREPFLLPRSLQGESPELGGALSSLGCASVFYLLPLGVIGFLEKGPGAPPSLVLMGVLMISLVF